MKLYARMLKLIVLATLFAAPLVHAQTDKTPTTDAGSQAKEEMKYFQLQFVVMEREGDKVINHRSYSMVVATNNKTQSLDRFRTGTKVPVETGDGKTNYLDVGINIDCRFIQQVNTNLLLNVAVDVSSLQAEASAVKGAPFILQNVWNSDVIVPLGKKTVIFSSDEVTSNRVMEVELTATPIQP